MLRDVYAYQRATKKSRISQKEFDRFTRSLEQVRKRSSLVPSIRYQTDLPIHDHLPQIERLLQSNQVVVVAGETGSGKTTQLPLACLKAGFGVRGTIGHTQPRRLAARSVADRIANQLGVELGTQVGYAVRFDDKVGDETLIKIMTDGLLLTEIRRDRYLNAYDTIIVDEAHERSLNIDFLLGYLKNLLTKRPDLRVIVTSATIDVEAFSKYFDNAPVVHVEGRAFPVDVRYRPPVDEIQEAVRECVEEIGNSSQSKVRDVLMFLSGEREILDWSHWFRRNFPAQFEILPLYARLPPKEQQKIFQRSSKQRILLTTNVAETSLTVPNVRYVIDLGEARTSRYSLQSRIQRLPIEAISQASANQRAGRCGRLAPGICYRLYSEESFERRSAYTDPEILRTNLATVLLQMVVFRYGDIETFPFLDAPNPRAINSAKRLLHELGAMRDERVTPLGRQMAQLPVDPRLARMLLEAGKKNALKEVLIIVAALAAQDPRVRPLSQQQAADEAQEQFENSTSDFLSFVALWNWAEAERRANSSRAFRRRLERAFVSPPRYEEWRSLHRQLRIACLRLGMKINRKSAEYEDVHCSILSGSLGFIGMRLDRDEYLGVRELKFRLFPGSGLVNNRPKWVVSAEIAETSRTYARCLARIEPRWIERYAASLLRHRPHDPYWDSEKKKSMVLVDISLSGIPLVSNRKVDWTQYDPEGAQRLFALHALVLNEGGIKFPEISANRSLVKSLTELQARERRLNVLASNTQLASFYESRIPDSVVDCSTFVDWYQHSDRASRKRLAMSEDDILLAEQLHLRPDAFPSELKIEDRTYPLKYQFNPGSRADGVSIRVPATALHELPRQALEWLVPGFFDEKCRELLRSLPKTERKKLGPLPDCVDQLLPKLLDEATYRQGSLGSVIVSLVLELFGVELPPDSWQLGKLPPHLFMNIQALDHRGRVIDQDRELNVLIARVSKHIEDRLAQANKTQFERKGLTEFPSAGIDWQPTIKTPSGTISGHTILSDEGNCVDVAVVHEAQDSGERNLRGICRFVLFAERQSQKFLADAFEKEQGIHTNWTALGYGDVAQLKDAFLMKTVSHVYFENNELPSTKAEFDQLIDSNRGGLVKEGLQLLDLVSDVLDLSGSIIAALSSKSAAAFESSRQDLQTQLLEVVPESFPFTTNYARLADVPRYLQAMEMRIANLQGKVDRDIRLTEEVHLWQQRLDQLRQAEAPPEELDELFHMLQEYRISVFCQTMKTRVRVSPKRLEESFASIEKNS